VAADLWIPDTAREKVARCFICQTRFPERQRAEWARHVAKCAKANEEVVAQAEADRTSSAYTQIYDKEQYDYLHKRAVERGELDA
jgi:hypothetical protein